jgi:hypothetical protein
MMLFDSEWQAPVKLAIAAPPIKLRKRLRVTSSEDVVS